MGAVIEFFKKLFHVESWPARWYCGEWTEFHGWLYVSSDITIWLAYFIIPVIIMWFIQKRPDIPFLPVFWLFGAFIILCGATHLMDAVIFWWPGYRLSALIRFFTAIVSLVTALVLIRDLPKMLRLSDVGGVPLEQDQSLNQELKEARDEVSEMSQLLAQREARIKTLNEEIENLRSSN